MNPTIWLTKASLYLRPRAIWAAVFAVAALVIRVASPSPPERTPEGVAAMLGAAVGGEVRADDFVWEARGGFWSDTFLGRRVLFVARKPGSPHADVYRARVRLTRGGRPVSLGMVRNLTRSPLGDDRELVAQGHHAAYQTRAFGAVQGVTLLDLDGEGNAREARGSIERAAAAIESWLATGSTSGIGRTEIAFGAAPAEAKHELQGDLLVMALGSEGSPAALDARDGSLSTGPSNAFGATAQRIPHHTPAIGAVATALARELLGDAAASVTRAVTSGVEGALARLRPAKRAPAAMPRGEAPGGAAEAEWPPPAIAPVIQPALAGEGTWVAGPAKRLGDAPASVVETAIRPDPKHPEALVRLAALDTRQLDLQLAAGVDEPRSPVGLHGSGRPPEGAERIVAAFAGGPAEARTAGEEASEPGFVADRRVFVPPAAGLATVAIAGDGKVRLGVWPEGGELGAVVSLRQAPKYLVNPDAGERSALGLTKGGQLVYAWGTNVSPETLRRALELAGCSYAVPLAAGPGVGLSSFRADRPEKRAENDMFYAVLRSAAPPAPPAGGATFAADGSKQPSPAWLPAVQKATVVSLGAQVHVTTFAPGRVAFRIRAGAREPQTKAVAALPTSLPEGEQARAIAAIGIGSGRRKGARGLWIDGAAALPIRGDDTGVLAFDGGRARVVPARELQAGEKVDATELPLTADDGKLRPASRDVGTMRPRAAACVLPDGTFAVASTTFDSDEATTSALLDLGCSRVVALDRGSHQPTFLHRAGSEQAPETRYDATVIFAVETPLSGRAGPL